MTRRAAVLVAALAFCLPGPPVAAAPHQVGFQHLDLAGPANTTLTASVFYPTDTPPTAVTIGPTTLQVARNAPLAGHNLPLILISHGNGGSSLSHADTAIALAQAGFVVAAVTHAGDNYADQSRRMQLQDRPPQITALLDTMLARWPQHAALDPNRIGAFGFSAGGFTTLALIGGKPDFSRVPPYCATHASTFVCTVFRTDSHGTPPIQPPNSFVADKRIRAAVIAAPALGFTFTETSLAAINIPVQLWGAGDDQTLPDPDNVERVHAALPPSTDYRLVPNAGHFDFLAPCSPALARIAPPICTEANNFNRQDFHQHLNPAIVAFFERTLSVGAGR